jgi:hypothetical protein
MAGREEILSRYSQQVQADQALTPSEFMLASNPGSNTIVIKRRTIDYDTGEVYYTTKRYRSSYSSRDSAGRAFRKLTAPNRGANTGEKLYRRSVEQSFAVGSKNGGIVYGKHAGQAQLDIWRIDVIMAIPDERTGKPQEDTIQVRSFIVQSSEIMGTYDYKRMEYALGDIVDEYKAYWSEHGSGGPSNDPITDEYQIFDISPVHIQHTNLSNSAIVDLDLYL